MSSDRKILKQDVNMDHLYCNDVRNSGFIKSSTRSDLISIIKENKQLKSMLLLHLDLIQEQSDQLLTKEKQISNLRQENESLKLKIDRMGKRMIYKQVPNHNIPTTVNGMTRQNGESSKGHFRTNFSGKCQTVPIVQNVKKKIGIRQEKSLPKIAEKQVKVNGLSFGKIVLDNVKNIQNITPVAEGPLEIKQEVTENHFLQFPESQNLLLQSDEPMIDSKDDVRNTVSEILKPKRRLSETSETLTIFREQSKKLPKIPPMVTKKQYMTRDWDLFFLEEELMQVIGKRETLEINLEVPSWRIVDEEEEEEDSLERETKAIYEDEVREDIYIKSHLKFEIDERRRKKWDVQRIREQRKIERLKMRQNKSKIRNGEVKASLCPTSFYPTPNTIHFIHIADELPVQAFGEVIPSLTPLGFTLPWMTYHESPHVVLHESQEVDKRTVSSIFVQRTSGHTKTLSKTTQKHSAIKR
ncbi:male-specific lethal 1 homolog [Phlebotomus papatasi]|uniref:male-specific lethal 1 homolog n=1 Tax=Phlebotomus papatasi TaxID=29031 RepID=UPI002483B2DA|nr:male-specific lethal 1 homolog [Phlebotomus papatasi]